MCSVGDDNFENETEKCMKGKEKINLPEKCNKCRSEKPYIVLRHKDVYCVNCFLAATTHKFKALLGKHRLIRPADKVLICFKTGHPSTSLLHFLRSGLDLTTPKKLRFEPVILYVENQVLLSCDERRVLMKNIQDHVKSFDFSINFVSLPKYVTNPQKVGEIITTNIDDLNLMEDDKDIIKKKIKHTNKTNNNEIIHIFERNLLVDVAKIMKCKFVFTPELSADVASQLLTNISLGRGAHVPLDTGFCDDRDDQVKILRPLRSFDIKELAFYNVFNKLEPISVMEKHENPYSSVQNLMKKFVTDLQVNYPATVTTILKTGDKLALDGGNTGKKCDLCKASLTENNTGISSAESTNFSHWVSIQTPDYSVSQQERYENTLETFRKHQFNDVCYSCNKLNKYIIK